MTRGEPLFQSFCAGALFLGIPLVNGFCASATTSALPWEQARSLRELAKTAFLESTLDPANPQPDTDAYPAGPAMTISSLRMRTTIWGPPHRVTISLTRNNVWDRRVNPVRVPTLQEITAGAFSPANKEFVNPKETVTTRPHSLGYFKVEGGVYDPCREPLQYSFPCLKPVGQIILGMDALAGAPAPRLQQSCADGVVRLQVEKGSARARLEYVLGMTSNIYAIRGDFAGVNARVWLRLYRHQDTAHLAYMTPDGKHYTIKGAEAGREWNGPIEPPQSGYDGRFFWIRQQLPAEKTFPSGFEYLLMGVVKTPGAVKIETMEGQTGLGTPPPDKDIAASPGAAATAAFSPAADGKLEALVTIVTTMDGPDLIAEARKRLSAADPGGFDAVVRENAGWWSQFYDRRETGRVFAAISNPLPSEDIPSLYRSWYCRHGGGTKTDMRQLEASAHYGVPEKDRQPWNGLPCYNEIFYTERFVHNQGDSVDMWKQIAEHWLPGAKQNARDMYGLPGMCLVHGYQPPIKPDHYVHTAIALEFCLGTMAGLLRPVRDEWDYGGDVGFLRETCYPLLKEMALFYAAYAKKGEDGYYHVIPSMQEECWGFYPEFARNKDVISSSCMFRWGLLRASEAAELLGVDAELRKNWREIAGQMAPYPTWKKPVGVVLAGIPGVEPVRYKSEHPWDAALYPAVLSDDINLDSPDEERQMVARTARLYPNAATLEALALVGAPCAWLTRTGYCCCTERRDQSPSSHCTTWAAWLRDHKALPAPNHSAR